MSNNDELYEIYRKADDILFGTVREINKNATFDIVKMGIPFFISELSGYINADIKLMIFGQVVHTYGDSKWESRAYGEDKNVEVGCMMDFYESFMEEKYGGRDIFQRTVRNLVKQVGLRKPNMKIDYLWNNIIKIGLLENKNADILLRQWYEKIIKPHLNPLISQEISLLKPDYVIFFSGYKYDNYINDIFNNPQWMKIENFEPNDFSEIAIPNVKKAFRTYHPRYLNTFHRKKEIFERIINGIE